MKRNKLLVLYHYYHPDDVVSATHFTNLCEGLAKNNWEVETWPGNRGCHNPRITHPTKPETLNSVTIHRVWRLPLRQHSFLGRIFNAIWIQKFWSWRLLFTPSLKPDVILIGSDPLFSVGLAPFLKFIRPKAKIVHWCFDLYPEAAIADGIIGENNPLVKLLRFGLKRAYKKCDLIVDLGPYMRKRLERYPAKGRTTLTPWALEEPSQPLPYDAVERAEWFGDSKLGLLYSGNFGRAHDYDLTLKLARLMKTEA